MEIDLNKLLKGDRRQLAKAITLIESTNKEHQVKARELLQKILPYTGGALRLGISGSPGVGKSTYIESLGFHLTDKLQKKIAVLAIDPSSPLTGGSILGDKTRMTKLSNQELAFIRPSPSGKHHGGIALKTREAMLLCEAAGFEVVIVETVGVGQAEYEVASMVDFFQILVLPNSGDELQGIKKGILELANAIVINKADGENKSEAQKTLAQYNSASQILSAEEKVKVFTCSAIDNQNIDKIWSYTTTFFENLKKTQQLKNLRANQNRAWFEKIFYELLNDMLFSKPENEKHWQSLQAKVSNAELDPYQAAVTFLTRLQPPQGTTTPMS